jgi:mercuric ion binding protein
VWVLAHVSVVEAEMHYSLLNSTSEQIRKFHGRRGDDIGRRRNRVQLPCALAELMMERSMTKFPTSLALGLLIVSSSDAMAEQRTVTLAVDNMYCEACPYMVKKTIEKVSGVSKITISFKEKTAVVVFDDARAEVKDLTNATTSVGFPSTPKSCEGSN